MKNIYNSNPEKIKILAITSHIINKLSTSPKWVVGFTVFWIGGLVVTISLVTFIIKGNFITSDTSIDFILKAIIVIAIFTSFIHFLLVYQSIDQMEESPEEFEKNFKGWFGTKPERVLRIFAIILMVSAGGELAYLSLSVNQQFILSVTHIEWQNPNKSIATFKIASLEFYTFSIALMFVFLFLWDLCSQFKSVDSPNDFRNKHYIISDLLALIIWVLLSGHLLGYINNALASILIAIFLLGYCLIISIRSMNAIRLITISNSQ